MKNTIYIFACLFFSFSQIHAEIKLPKLISDGMVLQRDKPIKIWGWADAQESVSLVFKDKTYKTKADAIGNWAITIPAQEAGGPFELKLKGTNELTVKDVLFGDVWFCSGQSNMVLNMERVKEKYGDDIAAANYPQIRNFFIPTVTDLQKPKADLPNSSWKNAVGADVLTFGAASFFFARKIYDKYKIPIGIINASVGGTPIEAWISEEGFKDFSNIKSIIERNKDTLFINNTNRKAAAANQRPPQQPTDKGLTESTKWFDLDYKPKGWHNINIPGYWEDQGLKDLNGVVWYRKEIDVPESMTGGVAKVFMGRIIDADFMYLNGKQIGNITYQYPPRRYEVPSGLLKAGKNIIVIRVINTAGKGGFVPDKPYFLTANGQKIDLKGEWQYKVGDVFMPPPFGLQGINAQNQPTALYNAMVAPLSNFAIKGILWYQGETNSGQPEAYAQFLPALIKDWRLKFNQPDAPFIFAQLPNYMDINYLPAESQWAEMRESQMKALSVPNTGMAVTIDAGEWNDIHPLNKKTVGERLALAAQKLAYNNNEIVYSGPLYQSHRTEGGKMVIQFSHIGSGLITNDDEELRWFAIAGADKKFVWAKAKIEGNNVVVWHESIQNPLYVRYAWADNPVDCNLYNKEGLPASPFRIEEKPSQEAWHGKKCAVALTYDDAINQHLDNAIPVLDSLGLKATFYLTAFSNSMQTRLNDWKKLAVNGHELGNHTLYHPCIGNTKGREWVSTETDMSKYTVKHMENETRMTNVFLQALDGKTKRTFAFTCGDREIGDSSFINGMRNDFVAARAVRNEMHKINEVDLMNVDCYLVNNNTFEQMKAWVDKAMETHSLLVILFHGVGGGNSLDVSLPAHRQFLNYIKEKENDIYVAPMLEVAEHIKEWQAKK